MKLTYYQGSPPNFGDELNPYMWPKLLPPGLLDEDGAELFLGIGSILFNDFPRDSRKFVFGCGYAGYTAAPDVHDGSWSILFVRGPRTAAKLALSPEKSICDSAVLLRALNLPAAVDVGIAFMPHVDSLKRGYWQSACRLAGIHMIDPRGDVTTVLAEIAGAKMLITEAMHGAIVADVLRTPWLAVQPIHAQHRMKWLDWSESLGLHLRVHNVRPTSLLELYVARTEGLRYYEGRADTWSRSALARPANHVLTHLAARHLQKLSRCEPQLSSQARLIEVTDRAMDALHSFVRSRHLYPTMNRRSDQFICPI